MIYYYDELINLNKSVENAICVFSDEQTDVDFILKAKLRLKAKGIIPILFASLKGEDQYLLTSVKHIGEHYYSKADIIDIAKNRIKLLNHEFFKERYKSHHDVERHYTKMLVYEKGLGNNQYFSSLTPSFSESAIYIHIPFCDRICSFCNLARTRLNDEIYDYVKKLVASIYEYQNSNIALNTKIDAIYFGGGTPTVMNSEMFKTIISAIKDVFTLTSSCEISCESTLHNVTDEEITNLSKIGINRFSFGIQTFNHEGRKFFNRTNDGNYAYERLKTIRQIFDGVLSIDIIYSYPNQDISKLKEDITNIKKLGIDSVSYYSLMVHSGSKISNVYSQEQISNNNDEYLHDYFIDQLIIKDEQFKQNEITKLCKSVDKYKYMACRHQGMDVIPFGKSAGGNIGNHGIFNMDIDKQMYSQLMNYDHLVLKKLKGITQKAYIDENILKKNFTNTHTTLILQLLTEYVNSGMYIKVGDRYFQTKVGTYYGNNIAAKLLDDFIKKEI